LAGNLERAKSGISKQLGRQPGGVFTERILANLLAEHGQEWGLAKSPSTRAFIKFLVEKLDLKVVELRTEQYGRVVRYAWGDYSPYLMALSLKPHGYLSHGTGVFLHGLNDQLPKTIYVNQEQSAKPPGSGLTQERLSLAFSRRQRTSRYIYAFGGYRAVLLSGKQTGALGVEKLRGPQREELPVTGLARTLIDIVVRPAYAGGILQVLEAYRGAKGRVDAGDIVRTLDQLHYVYPYHQAIGFMMEHSGFPEKDWRKLLALGTQFDFYLLHGMKSPKLNKRWRLFIPDGV